VFIGRRSHLLVGLGALLVAGGIAAGLALGLGGTSSAALTRTEYLARIEAICQVYARKLDRIHPPADIGTPVEVAYSIGAALPILKEQNEKARAVRAPTALRARVKRFFAQSDRSLAGLDEALRSAKSNDFGGMGHGYVQFVRARNAAQAEAKAIGFRC
jgi:hypothetical protein